MVISFVTDGKLTDIAEETDAVFIAPDFLGEVSYERERANMSKLCLAAKYSAACSVVFGAVTVLGAVRRRSAVVAQKGKLVTIADEVYADGKDGFAGGTLPQTLDTPHGKIGIAVAGDMLAPGLLQYFADAGCDVVCAMLWHTDEMTEVLARAIAYMYGYHIAVCAPGVCFCAEPTGTTLTGRTVKPVFSYGYREQKRRVRTGGKKSRADG